MPMHVALHEVRQPLGLSAFKVHGRLAAIQAGGVTRCPVPDVSRMTLDRLRRMTELLDVLPDCRDAIQNHAALPWRGIKKERNSLNLRADIEHHFERLALGLSQLRDLAPMLGSLGFAPSEPSVPEWLDAVEFLKDAPTYPLVPAEWFQANPRQIVLGYVQSRSAHTCFPADSRCSSLLLRGGGPSARCRRPQRAEIAAR